MEVNKKRLSEIFGVSIRTIQNWQDQGMPVARGGGKGNEVLYDSAQELKNAKESAEVVETAFCTFVLSRIAGEIASILDGIPLSVQRRFPELENRHIDFLKKDIIKAMNKAAALDEMIPGLLSEYIEQSG